MSESHAWKCRKGHTMGQVERNTSGIRVLLLYRQATPLPTSPLPAEGERSYEVDVMAVVEGYAADIRCSLCGEIRTWVPGEEALERLLNQVRRKG
jgi:hypothetical protein